VNEHGDVSETQTITFVPPKFLANSVPDNYIFIITAQQSFSKLVYQ